MKRFKNWKIATKIMSISIFTIVLIALGMMFYIMPLMENKLMGEKRNATKNVVDVAYTLIASYESRVKAGTMKTEEAQKAAFANIRSLRYQGDEYFGIMDLHAKMMMHPIKPELEGKDMSDGKDSNGKLFFQEFVKVAKDKGDGFVQYYWPKPNETKPSPKLTYIKLFPQWGCIIFSGIYIDDVNAEISKIQTQVIIATIAVALLILLIAFFVSRLITRPLSQAVTISKELAEGNLTVSVEVTSTDEVGQLLTGMKDMIEKLQSIVADVQTASDNVSSGSQQMSSTGQ